MIFIFISILIIIFIFWILMFNFDLNFRFEKCEVIFNEKAVNKFNIKELKLFVDLIAFGKFKILTVKVNQEYCELFNIKFNINGIKLSKEKNENSTIFLLKNLDELRPGINELELNLSFGTREMIITVFLVPVLSTFISFLYSKYSISRCSENFYLKVNPNYFNVNNFSLKFTSNIYVNVINFLIFIIKHRRK